MLRFIASFTWVCTAPDSQIVLFRISRKLLIGSSSTVHIFSAFSIRHAYFRGEKNRFSNVITICFRNSVPKMHNATENRFCRPDSAQLHTNPRHFLIDTAKYFLLFFIIFAKIVRYYYLANFENRFFYIFSEITFFGTNRGCRICRKFQLKEFEFSPRRSFLENANFLRTPQPYFDLIRFAETQEI